MFRHQSFIFFILSLFFLLFSLMPTVYEIVHSNRLHADRAFELIHNFPTDYNFYLSRIRQGIEGGKTVIEKYTSEPHEGSYIHIMYLGLGWVGGWVRVPWERGGDVYHVARIVLGMTLLLLIGEYAKRSFSVEGDDSRDAVRGSSFAAHPSSKLEALRTRSAWEKLRMTVLEKTRRAASVWQIIAFLLAVTASTWPKLVWYGGGWRFGGYMPWWSVMDSLQRIVFIPHLLAGQALIIFLLLTLSGEEIRKNPQNGILLGILGFLLGMVFPPGLFFVYVTLGVMAMVEVYVQRIAFDHILKNVNLQRLVVSLGIFFLLSVPALLYLKLMTGFYPWHRLVEVDAIRPLPFDYIEYIKAVGPILPLGLLGLLVAFIKKEKRMVVSISWIISWIGLLIMFQFVPQQSPLRFSEMIPHVPLGILTAYLFYVIGHFFSGRNFLAPLLAGSSINPSTSTFVGGLSSGNGNAKLEKRSAKISSLKVSKVNLLQWFLFATPMALIAIGFGVMYSSFLWQRDFIDHKMAATSPLVPTGAYVMYPLKDFLAAMSFIQDYTLRDSVILSDTTAGNYLPVYSGNTVYVGHDNTVALEQKIVHVRAFFGGNMKKEEALQWLQHENIHIIFFGPQEREDGPLSRLETIYPFLRPVYTNASVTVYEVVYQ